MTVERRGRACDIVLDSECEIHWFCEVKKLFRELVNIDWDLQLEFEALSLPNLGKPQLRPGQRRVTHWWSRGNYSPTLSLFKPCEMQEGRAVKSKALSYDCCRCTGKAE